MPFWGSSNKAKPLSQHDSSWAPLAPTLGVGSSSTKLGSTFASVLKPGKPSSHHHGGAGTGAGVSGPMVGRWPESVLLRIAEFLPVPDLPQLARANRAFSRIVRDERAWKARCLYLRLDPKPPGPDAGDPESNLVSPSKPAAATGAGMSQLSPTRRKSLARGRDSMDDDFGDFSAQNDTFEDVDFGDLTSKANGAGSGSGTLAPPPLTGGSQKETNLLDFDDLPLPSRPSGAMGAGGRTSGFFALTPSASGGKPRVSTSVAPGATRPGAYYLAYKAHHQSMLPLCQHLRSSPSPSSTLALLFPPDPRTSLPPNLGEQADRLLALLLFLSPRLQPLTDWGFLRQALLAAADRFDSTCLVAFETADSRADEPAMRLAAESSWKVWEAGGGSRDQWECGRVWVEKREVFYETGKWDPLENIVRVTAPNGAAVRQLDFTPMDAFIAHVLETFRIEAELAVRIFPSHARVVLSFCDRVASDVIGEYITPLLSQARVISPDLFLQATAASFVQASKLIEVAMEVLGAEQAAIPQNMLEDVIYRMFEVHMDEYLDEETEWVKNALEAVCRQWEQQQDGSLAALAPAPSAPTFLTASNPDQVKRNVLAGFRDVLLLPVTIVPRTVNFGVNAIVAGGTATVNGLAMLNPQKWAGSAGNRAQVMKQEPGAVVFDAPATVDTEETKEGEATTVGISEKEVPTMEDLSLDEKAQAPESAQHEPANSLSATPVLESSDGKLAPASAAPTRGPSPRPDQKHFDRLQLLVSLDTALQLIQTDRDSLKRCETFAKYPGKYGVKVREAIEEIFILMLKAAGDRHIAPGFRLAQNAMLTYKPAEHEETQSVAPLLQFFELVHIGDTIQSMVQVYFDKELAQYVDRTDFLNAVMREKKRFESVLDDAVAAGLNAGIEVLMNQVEHIILVKTGPREYYPTEGTPLELGPTEGCKEAIACLEMHCDLLRGSTSKEVLEVFYQEVGIRLQQILQRHLKRQIISLEGGFQIIADLNAYHAFVASLKQQRITDDFANLKMLGHVYIVSDAKDLAQIVRDVTRYGGTFRPEDIYEFIQRRADWKKIEKTVDKAMYALSVKDDCVIM